MLLYAEVTFPQLDNEALRIILEDMSEGFDWSGISPPIFGAIFESILNEDTSRIEGSHYTSIENIYKVIDPLFMDKLSQEADELLANSPTKQKLRAFQKKLAGLTFFDPACRLENKIICALTSLSYKLDRNEKLIRVSISQFKEDEPKTSLN